MTTDRIVNTRIPQGYEELHRVFIEAYHQASLGKGDERHGHPGGFGKQTLMTDLRLVGLGGPVYQIRKKALEAMHLAEKGNTAAARRDLYGVMVYAAAIIMHLEEGGMSCEPNEEAS